MVVSSIGVLLALAPSRPTFPGAIRYIREEVERGVPVYVYALDEGVTALASRDFVDLGALGARLFACNLARERFRIPQCPEVVCGGLGVLEDLFVGTSRFAIFTPRSSSGPSNTEAAFPEVGSTSGDEPKKVVVVLANPPESDAFAAEGLRVASGLAAGRRLRVTMAFPGRHGTPSISNLRSTLEPALAGYLDVFVTSGGKVLGDQEEDLAREVASAFAVARF